MVRTQDDTNHTPHTGPSTTETGPTEKFDLLRVSRLTRRHRPCTVFMSSSPIALGSVSSLWLVENYDRPGLSSSSSRPRVVHERPAHGGLPPQGPSHPAGTSERDRGQPREVESSRPSSQKRMMDHWERGERQGRKRNHREAGFDEGESDLSSALLFVTQLEAGHSLTSCHLNIAQSHRRDAREGCEATRCPEVRSADGRSSPLIAFAGPTSFSLLHPQTIEEDVLLCFEIRSRVTVPVSIQRSALARRRRSEADLNGVSP